MPRHKCPTLGTSASPWGTLVPRIILVCPGDILCVCVLRGGGGGGDDTHTSTLVVKKHGAELKCPIHLSLC